MTVVTGLAVAVGVSVLGALILTAWVKFLERRRNSQK